MATRRQRKSRELAPDGKPDLAVQIGSIRMKNPVMVASGTFGYGQEYANVVDIERLGAVVVKGVSADPWEGNPTPRMVEVTGGILNSIGLQNPGAKSFVEDYMPFLRCYDVPIIVNIWGRSVGEYVEVTSMLDRAEGIDGYEVNVSCPNIKEGGIAFGTDPKMLSRVVSAVRDCTRRTVIVKLSPNVSNIAVFAEAAEDSGADAVSLINTIPAMKIDVESRSPCLGNIIGGLSGPAVHPVAVRLVWDAAKAVKIPVIGMGGITSGNDAIEMLIAGASAVAVGTANFSDPGTALRVVEQIAEYLERHEMASVGQLVGSLNLPKKA